jgi:hypothetical protein
MPWPPFEPPLEQTGRPAVRPATVVRIDILKPPTMEAVTRVHVLLPEPWGRWSRPAFRRIQKVTGTATT